MSALRDYFGVLIVVGGVLLGAAVALAASSVAQNGGGGIALLIAPTGGGQAITATAAPGRAAAEALPPGDRATGRIAFRTLCQDCHTQGRQSFPPDARQRLTLIQSRVREGFGEMPSFPSDRLTDDTLRHILSYVVTPAGLETPEAAAPRIRGLNLEIVEASGVPGQPATVRFRVRDDAGQTINPSDLAVLALTVAGPTVDYTWFRREDARRALVLPDGTARWTFAVSLPADATGTFGAAMEAAIDHPAGTVGPGTYREAGYNPIAYFGVTDSAPVPHQAVVQTANCNGCHGTLSAHGGTRNNTDYCVMCHNVVHDDIDKRKTAGGPMPPEPVLFRNFIHRIHTGEDLTHPFVVYGGNPANPQAVDLAEVPPFPKDRANCTVCHLPGTFVISDVLAHLSPMTVSVNDQVVRQVPPITATCTGCHDSDRTLAHAANQTTAQGVETCAICHGAGRPYSVSSVHRIAPASASGAEAPAATVPGG